jgi:hypothetical protein
MLCLSNPAPRFGSLGHRFAWPRWAAVILILSPKSRQTRRKACSACWAKRKPRRPSRPSPCIEGQFCVADVVDAPQWGAVEPLRWCYGRDKLQPGGDGPQRRHSVALGTAWGRVGLCQADGRRRCDRASRARGMGGEVIPLGAESRHAVASLLPRLAAPVSVCDVSRWPGVLGRGLRAVSAPSLFLAPIRGGMPP